MRKSLMSYLFAALTILIPLLAEGQNIANQPVRLKQAEVLPWANAGQWMDSINNTGLGQPCQVLLHFDQPVTQLQKAQLSANGITLLDYVTENTYSAIIQRRSARSAPAFLPAYGISPVERKWKADKYIWLMASR